MPGAGGQPPQRTTFRPPWVKDGPPPIPMPAAPWTLNSRRDSKTPADDAPAFTKVTLKSVPKPADIKPAESTPASSEGGRKTSKITIVPSQPKSEKNAAAAAAAPATPTTTSSKNLRENGRPEPSSGRPQLERQVRVERSRSRGEPFPLAKSESTTTTGAPTLSKSASRANIPPPPPPRPPPPPPSRNVIKDLPPLTEKQKMTLEMLKSRPRKRPDWTDMMKEVESGKKLRHVQCNDRSAPLIERVKVTKVTADPQGEAHFVFDSEKSNMHNKLLQQIQEGVKLKSVKTNDRSKPLLAGLRKFRRQLTIEEQMQKAEQAPEEEEIVDEMDDIDAVRDDLQSTKQMLALELRNKEALERENKRLQSPLAPSKSPEELLELQREKIRSQARILNLEVELERERSQKTIQEHKQQDVKLTESLKQAAEQARQDAERLEKDFASAAEERDKAKNELEEMKRMYANLEKRMKAANLPTNPSFDNNSEAESDAEEEEEEDEDEKEESNKEDEEESSDCSCEEEQQQQSKLQNGFANNNYNYAINKSTNASSSMQTNNNKSEPIIELPASDNDDDDEDSTACWWDVSGMALAGCPSAKDVARIATQKSMDKPEPEESEEEEEESSEEESDEDEDPKVAEEKRQQREIKLMKTKIRNFKDKTANSKKERQALKEQIKQQQKLLKEEKKKFKSLQKEVDKMAKLMADASEEDEDEEDEDEDEEEEETESEEDSESEESEDEDDSETDDEAAPIEKRKDKLQNRVKRHENRLGALKKGNYLLKAQVDRLKDDLSKQREESLSLQEDLDSVLAELG